MITVSIHGPFAATRTSHKHGTREVQFDTIDVMDNAGNVIRFFGEPGFQLPNPDMNEEPTDER